MVESIPNMVIGRLTPVPPDAEPSLLQMCLELPACCKPQFMSGVLKDLPRRRPGQVTSGMLTALGNPQPLLCNCCNTASGTDD